MPINQWQEKKSPYTHINYIYHILKIMIYNVNKFAVSHFEGLEQSLSVISN